MESSTPLSRQHRRTRDLLALSVIAVGSSLAASPTPAAATAVAPTLVPCTSDNAANVAALRSAIAAANAAASGVVTLAPECTYSLTQPDNSPTYTTANGLPIITGAVTIEGQGATVQRETNAGSPAFRFFLVANGGSLVIDRLTLRGGVSASGGAVLALTGATVTVRASSIVDNRAQSGGAINAGTRTSIDIGGSTISGNAATAVGGGILSAGTTSITESSVSANSASAGGGVENVFGTLSIVRSTIAGNTADAVGGGVDSEFGTATVGASTVARNHAGMGGGIFNNGALLMVNTTVSANGAAVGAGVANHHFRATLVNDTLADNTVSNSGSGGAVYNEGGDYSLVNTIVAANPGGNCNDRLGTAVTDGGHTLSYPTDDRSCPASFGRGDPLLGPLDDNGGPTQTMAPALGSAAIDAGDDTVCAAPVAAGGAGGNDERGVVRPQGRHCDIGAVEVAHGVRLLYEPSLPRPAGAALPIRLQLLDPEGANVSSPATALLAVGVETVAPPEGSSGTRGCAFSEDGGGGGSYRCVLGTEDLPPGRYVLVFMASDGPSRYRAPFTVASSDSPPDGTSSPDRR